MMHGHTNVKFIDIPVLKTHHQVPTSAECSTFSFYTSNKPIQGK